MDTTTYFHSSYSDQTTLHPLGLAMVLVCGLLMQFLPRRYALWPMIVVACFVAPAQRLVVFTLDFDLLRIMVLFGWARLTLRREWSLRLWGLDYAILVLTMLSVVMPTLTSGGSSTVLVNKLGYAFDGVGIYLLCRCLIRDWDGLRSVILGFGIIVLPVTIAFLVEKSTGRNAFALFGGVPAITDVREGRLRCQGAFAHSILAGCFWAGIMPLVAAMWWNGWRPFRVVLVLAAMSVIVVTCSSSTPVMAVIFTVVGGAAYSVRHWMQFVRWGILFSLVFLHMIMKAPVWELIARIDIVSGSTGWHRFNLIDGAIRNVHEWFLMGSTVGTAHWAYGAHDVTNYYVVHAIHGGILQLGAFVAVIALAFAGIGQCWRAAGNDRAAVIMSWALGIAMFTHTMNFFAISYFGQINLVWYLTLGTIGSLTAATRALPARAPARRKARVSPLRAEPSLA